MRNICLFIALALLSGCASLLPEKQAQPVYEQWENHQHRLTDLNHWQVDGRIFVQTKEDGFSSSIRWQQHDQAYQLRFSAPFGQGIYHLSGEPGKVSIVLPDNTEQQAKDPESLIKQTLGFKLPVNGLNYWIRGLPDPADPARDIVLDSNERLIDLKQAGWQIHISRYRKILDYFLPEKLTMENRHLKIKMVIKAWDISG